MVGVFFSLSKSPRFKHNPKHTPVLNLLRESFAAYIMVLLDSKVNLYNCTQRIMGLYKKINILYVVNIIGKT